MPVKTRGHQSGLLRESPVSNLTEVHVPVCSSATHTNTSQLQTSCFLEKAAAVPVEMCAFKDSPVQHISYTLEERVHCNSMEESLEYADLCRWGRPNSVIHWQSTPSEPEVTCLQDRDRDSARGLDNPCKAATCRIILGGSIPC